jgi:thiol-disulfide isomerase/thioredoxin
MWSKANLFREIRRRGAVVSLLLGAFIGTPAAAVQVGDKFPTLSQYKLEDLSVESFDGKIVVVDFWASWCAPCKASFPALAALQEEFKGKVVVIGVSVDAKRTDYERFVKRLKPGFPTARDADHGLSAAAKPPTMPSSYVVDRHGIVRFVHAGFRAETAEELRRNIRQLLEEKS